MSATNRNRPCYCGSGKKEKRCCQEPAKLVAERRQALAVPAEHSEDCSCCENQDTGEVTMFKKYDCPKEEDLTISK